MDIVCSLPGILVRVLDCRVEGLGLCDQAAEIVHFSKVFSHIYTSAVTMFVDV